MATPEAPRPGPSQPSLLDPGATLGPGEGQTPEFAAGAAVLVDTGLPHLDRTFDYGVPPRMAPDVRPGTRVRVRFAGQERDGFVLAVGAPTTHTLQPLRRVVSPLVVLTPEILALAESVASHYAGTLSDVLRLAVPPRHARTEKAVLTGASQPNGDPDRGPSGEGERASSGEPDDEDLVTAAHSAARDALLARAAAAWESYSGGGAFIRRLSEGDAPRAAWVALPDPAGAATSWTQSLAAAAAATLGSGRSALLLAPTAHDVAQLTTTLDRWELDHVTLTAEAGPADRYRAFLAALTGRVRLVVGTRSAAFAPVSNLGLVACWDDGHDAYAEPRAPYPHARQVLALRAQAAGAAALFGGYARSVETQELVRTGWARDLSAPRQTVRRATPRVVAPDDYDLQREGAAGRARFPRPAWELTRRALAAGPVLVQVPRAGYLPSISCAGCRQTARCAHCNGPLAADGTSEGTAVRCRWCARSAHDADDAWHCPHCGARRFRAGRIGSHRTAEELGRSFPGVPVLVSGRAAGIAAEVDSRPRLVIATPGAEPPAEGGYQAAICLDAALLTNRPELGAGVEALRRWLRAAALVRPDGTAMVLGDGAPAVVQAFVRWDPVGFAARELTERIDLRFPPAVRMIAVTGQAADLRSFRRHCRLPAGTVELGPVPVDGPHEPTAPDALLAEPVQRRRLLLRIEAARGLELSAAVQAAQAIRSARKEGSPLHVHVDPDVV